MRIWNRALSTAEVQQQMSHRLVGSECGLIGLWTLNEAAGDRVSDRSPSGHDGILRNATWAEPPSPSPVTLKAHAETLATPAIREALARSGSGPAG